MKTIILVSGFLGVGKTTLMKIIIDKLVPEKLVMIIENDFGDINIDTELLKGYELKVTEITAGCICCSLVGDFEKAIDEIQRDYNPDVIIIEPSGVADTSQLINICLNLRDEYRLNSINIIDGNNHFMYLDNFEEFYKNQILSANNIVINRIDDLSTDGVEKIKDSIESINSFGKIYFDSGDLDVDLLIVEENEYTKIYDFDMHIENIFQDYSSISLVITKVFYEESLNNTLTKLLEDTDIVRVKGFINLEERVVRVDFTRGHKKENLFEEIDDYTGVGKLVVIGKNFDKIRAKDILGR